MTSLEPPGMSLRRRIAVAAPAVLLVALLLVWFLRGPRNAFEENVAVRPDSTRSDSTSTALPATPVEPPTSTDTTMTITPRRDRPMMASKRRKRTTFHPSGRIRTSSIAGRLDSWEDWNSSFQDTVSRTCSAIFDSARVDTITGGRLGFAASGRREDLLPVRKIFCRIDSVHPFVKYTFPGQSVDFIIGIAFDASASFTGRLHPSDTLCPLTFIGMGESAGSPDEKFARNQITLHLTSPPGYRYIIRAAIQCSDGAGEETTNYYTRPAVVEFRRMVKYQELLDDAADTVFLATENPKAVVDLSRSLPHSIVSAVFVSSPKGEGAENIPVDSLRNLRLRLRNSPFLNQAFVVLNPSKALVEGKELDPEFKHILQLRRKGAHADRVGYPRVTRLVMDSGEVAVLYRKFQRFVEPGP